jgi:hypothetical protein
MVLGKAQRPLIIDKSKEVIDTRIYADPTSGCVAFYGLFYRIS